MEQLPRFLLPRLSWSVPVPAAAARGARPLASLSSQDRMPWQRSIAAIHTRPAARSDTSNAIGSSVIIRRAFHATALRQRDHHFDTLKFVQRLQSEGFTEDQSVAMMKVLNDVIEER